ncbi:PQQ-binding-like beta-propeller repeat protein [Actinoplanes sp. NPDC049668]|uniref:outer membrane protein assembly factor BamB family protein n=1 Tax=unclassified Actinoplanes TaxID=2626549 RepID=UPI0033A9BC99
MTVIELGLVTDGGDQPPVDRPRRRLRRSELRRALVAAVAVLCAVTVTGSARPVSHSPVRLWSTPYRDGAETFTVAGGAVYVLSQSGATRLTAYDLSTGAVRWSNSSLGDAKWLGPVQAGVLLLPAAYSTALLDDPDGTEVSREFSRETVAVDTATGRQLWRGTGELAVAAGGRALLTQWSDDGGRVDTLRVVRLADGGMVWSRPAEGLESWSTEGLFQDRADRLVTASASGDVEVRDLADGSLVAAATLPWSAPDTRNTAVTVDGHRLYVEHSGGRTTVTAYDTETLRRLWHIEPDSPGGSYSCGPVFCVNGPQGTAGYDRDTGELRWRIPGSANAFPFTGGQLMVDDDQSGARHHLVDAATGRRLVDLGTASPVWNFPIAVSPYLLTRTREPLGLMAVSRFDARSGQVLLIGAMPPVIEYGCQNEGTLLACATQDGRLAVTDVG